MWFCRSLGVISTTDYSQLGTCDLGVLRADIAQQPSRQHTTSKMYLRHTTHEARTHLLCLCLRGHADHGEEGSGVQNKRIIRGHSLSVAEAFDYRR